MTEHADQTSEREPVKALILAAGDAHLPGDDTPLVLYPLAGRAVIDYVIENALHLCQPKDIYVVVGYQREEVTAHIHDVFGGGFHYVRQDEPLGTGHAVLQTKAALADFVGDILILYGDTPLFSASSIRGLLNRHRLKNAALTLLTAVVSRPLPYGRIIRDRQDRLIDIIESAEATADTLEIMEINVGAYVVHADILYPMLERLPPSPVDGERRLTDCVHALLHSRSRVESYRIYDEGEVQGINTREDLEHAEFILQTRLFRPRRIEEESLIHFGTGGWRAVISEGFTMRNVRRLSQAIANKIIRDGNEQQGVLIGYDRRFLSDRAAQTSSEVFAGNNIPVILVSEDAPTPLIMFATHLERAAYGLAFTASHNPPEYNGLKVFRTDGSLLLTEETEEIEGEANALDGDDIARLDYDIALESGILRCEDYTARYVDSIEAQVDMGAIRRAGLRVIVDPMYGVGEVALNMVLTEARCRVRVIHELRNPLFGGRSPAPSSDALRMLSTHIKDEGYDLGLATDGDADRIAILDERGEYVPVNDTLLLLYYYLHEVRGETGGIVRNLATTHLLDRLAARLGETCIEVPVGFKFITQAMVEHNALLGGESSGGLTIRGHILGKDGILAAALITEMIARTGKRISELLDAVYAITGHLYTVESNVPATPEMKIVIPRRLRETTVDRIGAYPVIRTSHSDGFKFYLENDNWLLLRFSGTESLLRVWCEADTPEKGQELVRWGQDLIRLDAPA
ncbi:MAG: NTP transferase domain-containing protein [Anaerolineae bacterium]|nr:NTP transferase domain-containing protein [Anaerolineae bacterium]